MWNDYELTDFCNFLLPWKEVIDSGFKSRDGTSAHLFRNSLISGGFPFSFLYTCSIFLFGSYSFLWVRSHLIVLVFVIFVINAMVFLADTGYNKSNSSYLFILYHTFHLESLCVLLFEKAKISVLAVYF